MNIFYKKSRKINFFQHIYDERNPSVKHMLKTAIQACKRNGIKISICEQGPSDYPELAGFLVEQGIDNISVIPDSLVSLCYS